MQFVNATGRARISRNLQSDKVRKPCARQSLYKASWPAWLAGKLHLTLFLVSITSRPGLAVDAKGVSGLLAFPYGLVADKYGRRLVMAMSMTGTLLMYLTILFICKFPSTELTHGFYSCRPRLLQLQISCSAGLALINLFVLWRRWTRIYVNDSRHYLRTIRYC